MGIEWLAPLMFIAALLFIFSGYPVAFSLGGVTIVFAILGVSTGYFHLPLLLALPDRVSGIMSNYILLAVPFFIFMGTMLEKSGLAEDLLKTMGQMFGPVRGGARAFGGLCWGVIGCCNRGSGGFGRSDGGYFPTHHAPLWVL